MTVKSSIGVTSKSLEPSKAGCILVIAVSFLRGNLGAKNEEDYK